MYELFGRFAGSGTTAPARVRIRLIVARDSVTWWWWVRCQPRVSAPASRPASVSVLRSSRTRWTVAGSVALGEDLGRRERAWNAASPSARHRAMSLDTH